MKKPGKTLILALTASLIISVAACGTNSGSSSGGDDDDRTSSHSEEKSTKKVSDKPFTYTFFGTDDDIEGTYAGEWEDDAPNGNGVFASDNFTYDGSWADGKPDGKGTITENCTDDNGEKFTRTAKATFADGEPEGTVTLSTESENGMSVTATINIESGSMTGNLKIHMEFPAEDGEGTETIDYSGQADGGEGELNLVSGESVAIYKGDFYSFTSMMDMTVPEMTSGTVTTTSAGAEVIYEGGFLHLKPNGEGKLTATAEDGSRMVEEGEFVNGKLFTGSYVVYDKDGNVAKRDTYKEGQQVLNYEDNDILSTLHDIGGGIASIFGQGDAYNAIWDAAFDDIPNAIPDVFNIGSL